MKDIAEKMAELEPLLNGIDAMRDTIIDLSALDGVIWDDDSAEERAAASRDVELAMEVLKAAHKFLQSKAHKAKLKSGDEYYYRIYEDAHKYRVQMAEEFFAGLRKVAPSEQETAV